MHWNYRVMHTVEEGEDVFSIVEVYYDDGAMIGYSDPVHVSTNDDLKLMLDLMQKALDKPTLTPEDFRKS